MAKDDEQFYVVVTRFNSDEGSVYDTKEDLMNHIKELVEDGTLDDYIILRGTELTVTSKLIIDVKE